MSRHERGLGTISPGRSHASSSRRLLQYRWSRPSAHAALFRFLEGEICSGCLTVVDAGGGAHTFGPGGTPAVTVRLHDRALPRRLLANPNLAVGEAYTDGTLTVEEGALHEFLHVCTTNLREPVAQAGHWIRQWLEEPLRYRHQRNAMWRARANASHHSDLSGALYDLFLDRDRQYSCGYFPEGGESKHRRRRSATSPPSCCSSPG